MPTGTWNEGRLRKKVDYLGLKDMVIDIIDTNPTSTDFFDITDFPDKFTSGKNLFKIKANSQRLVQNSPIYIEILDPEGNTVFNDPLNYVEQDGTRVVSVHIDANTPSGNGIVYVAGRAEFNQSGQSLPFSRTPDPKNPRLNINVPNVLWSRTITFAPELLNNTEIIHITQPRGVIREVIQPYLETVNLTDVHVEISASNASASITPIPSSINRPSIPNIPAAIPQGFARGGSPPRSFGRQVARAPQVSRANSVNQPTQVESTDFDTVTGESLLRISGLNSSGNLAFPLSSSMEGGTITIVNPIVPVSSQTAINAAGQAVPVSQFNPDI